MKILYARYRTNFLIELVNNLSFDRFSVSDINLLNDLKDKLVSANLSRRTFYPRGFPTLKEIQEIIQDLCHNTYLKACYSPKKSS